MDKEKIEAIRTVLQVYDNSKRLEAEEGMEIFTDVEAGFITALNSLGWDVVRKEE